MDFEDWVNLILFIVIIVVGILAGIFVQTLPLIILTVFSLFFSWVNAQSAYSKNDYDGAMIILIAVIISAILAWITWYFVTKQHWVGDFFREFIFR